MLTLIILQQVTAWGSCETTRKAVKAVQTTHPDLLFWSIIAMIIVFLWGMRKAFIAEIKETEIWKKVSRK